MARFGILLQIRALNDEFQPSSRFKQRSGGPDFDIQRHRLSRFELQLAPVKQHRLMLGGAFAIEFPMRSAQPAERHRAIIEKGVIGERYEFTLRIEFIDADEE